jgi:mono/diheme cytochrome c family protein
MRALRLTGMMLAAAAVALLCSSCGPRMRTQASIHPFEKQMPRMPAGTAPTNASLGTGYNRQFAPEPPEKTNPLEKNEENTDNGRIYYGYYCLMCHGAKGDGNGPAGQSYVPKPTDLSSPAVQGLTDAGIYRRMLVGTGHEPVLATTVWPDQRWPLVMYVRTFAKKPSGG